MKYPWAVNEAKAHRACADMKEKAKIDSSIVVDDTSIKARYIALGGLIREVDEDAEVEEVPVKKARKSKKADEEVDEDAE